MITTMSFKLNLQRSFLMRKLHSTDGDIIATKLKQLHPHEVNQIMSHLYYIVFKFESNIEVSYVYNINVKKQYFLQRIAPYPLPKGLFSTQNEIIDFIEKDISKFKNASHSSNFNSFLNITNNISQLEQTMERLFLNFNVSKESIHHIQQLISDLNLEIQKAQNKSMHIMINNK